MQDSLKTLLKHVSEQKQNTANNNEASSSIKTPWLTKDRKWNFFFWIMMSLGFGIMFGMMESDMKSNIVSYKSKLGSLLFFTCLIVIPLLLKYFNGTKFLGKQKYANSEGQILKDEQIPYWWGRMLFLGIPPVFIVSELILTPIFGQTSTSFLPVFFISISFLAPFSLYFIIKDCPIAILFNKHLYTMQGSMNTRYVKKWIKNIIEE